MNRVFHMTTPMRIAASYLLGTIGYAAGMVFSVLGHTATGLLFLGTTLVLAAALFCSQAVPRL